LGDADPQCAATFRVLALGLLGMDGCSGSVPISLRRGFPNAAGATLPYLDPFDCAVIRLYDSTGNVIETHEHAGDFNEW
jgi:hypothetical protein